MADADRRARLVERKSALQVVIRGTTVLLDLAGAVDLEKERARLAKEAAALAQELDKIAQKLGNPQFVAKARPEAVEEQREREAEKQAALSASKRRLHASARPKAKRPDIAAPPPKGKLTHCHGRV